MTVLVIERNGVPRQALITGDEFDPKELHKRDDETVGRYVPESQLSAAIARASELEKIVAAGDELCQAAIRCGVHTWQSIQPEARQRAVEFGFAMMRYHAASPTCGWPEDATAIRDMTIDDRLRLLQPETKGKTDAP